MFQFCYELSGLNNYVIGLHGFLCTSLSFKMSSAVREVFEQFTFTNSYCRYLKISFNKLISKVKKIVN